jgi:Asp-tRNA(Asn)/Glu-tRNA(Gln) amidotransferase B subunit
LYLRRYRHADWKQVYQLAQQVRPPHQGGVLVAPVPPTNLQPATK